MDDRTADRREAAFLTLYTLALATGCLAVVAMLGRAL